MPIKNKVNILIHVDKIEGKNNFKGNKVEKCLRLHVIQYGL